MLKFYICEIGKQSMQSGFLKSFQESCIFWIHSICRKYTNWYSKSQLISASLQFALRSSCSCLCCNAPSLGIIVATSLLVTALFVCIAALFVCIAMLFVCIAALFFHCSALSWIALYCGQVQALCYVKAFVLLCHVLVRVPAVSLFPSELSLLHSRNLFCIASQQSFLHYMAAPSLFCIVLLLSFAEHCYFFCCVVFILL